MTAAAAARPEYLDEPHRRTAQKLLAWSLRHCTCARGRSYHERGAYLAATYDAYCAPPRPTTGLDGHEVDAGGLLVLFVFLVEDVTLAENEALVRFLTTGAADEPNEGVACARAILGTLHRKGIPTGRLEETFRTWASRARDEQSLDPEELTLATYWPYRRHTILVPLFLECWTTALGLHLPAHVEEALDLSGLPELSAHMVVLANDLGSLDRDAARRADDAHVVDINSVLLLEPTLGSRDAAVRHLVEEYRQDVERFATRATRLLAEHGRTEPRLRDRVELIRRQTNGNLDSVRHLTDRYPGSRERLRELYAIPDISAG
ncbi:terpene synthase family protein [Streptomyces sp. NPDC047981]|uniref:terpene synthase family protein n=1 Tax=Streptomyces sp. NPDC047981 TaxID=3154610 RepID=UPI0034476EC5